MFQMDTIKVPVLGLVENMAWFTPSELPSNKYFIFGKDGCKNLAHELNVPLLGQIPLVQGICEGGDSGRPVVLEEGSPASDAMMLVAANLAQQVAIRNATIEPTKTVQANAY